MSRPSRGQPFRTTTTAGICDIFDAAHSPQRGTVLGKDRLRYRRGGGEERYISPLVVSYFVGEYILSGKKNRCPCVFPPSVLLFLFF